MGVKSAAFTVIAILGIIVGAGYAIIMTFHTLLVGSSVSRGSEDDKRSVTSRLFGNGIAVAVGAVLITSVMILVGMIRAGGLAGLRERRKPVPYMQAMNFPPDRRYEVFGTAPSTPLGKLLAKVDRIVFVLFGVRIVGTDLLIAARMASMAEASPQLRKVFGPQDDYREGVAALAKDWQGGAPFNRCAGLIGFHHYIKQAMDSRQSVIQYHVAHPEVSKLPVARPLLLIGLPRTGTTLLHRLLSLDPMSRTLRNWECCKPVPPPRRETYMTDSRISSIWSTWKRVHWLCPGYFTELWKFHFFHPAEVEEETLIFPGAFLLTGMAPLGTGGHSSANYDAWYRRTDNKRGAYKYLRAVLQVLSSKYGPGTAEEHTAEQTEEQTEDVEASPDEVGGEHVTNGRWVLKCPFHALWLDTLLQEFPDADFICTHRPAHEMVPSWAKFQALTFKMLYDDESRADSREFAKVIADGFEEQLERLEQERSRQEKMGKGDRFCDVDFKQLVKEPKTVVRRIYDHFGFDFTAEFEARIDAFMGHNPRYKHGKPEYSLQEFGLDAEEIKERFARFDPARRIPATPTQQAAAAQSKTGRVHESPSRSPPSSLDGNSGDRDAGTVMAQTVATGSPMP